MTCLTFLPLSHPVSCRRCLCGEACAAESSWTAGSSQPTGTGAQLAAPWSGDGTGEAGPHMGPDICLGHVLGYDGKLSCTIQPLLMTSSRTILIEDGSGLQGDCEWAGNISKYSYLTDSNILDNYINYINYVNSFFNRSPIHRIPTCFTQIKFIYPLCTDGAWCSKRKNYDYIESSAAVYKLKK